MKTTCLANVVVTDNLITAVSTEPLAIAGGTVIDGGGRTLMPGLTDCHWHSMAANISGDVFAAGAGKLNLVAAQGAEKTLMRGFTSIRDMGGPRIRPKRGDRRGYVRWSQDLRCGCDDLPNVGPCRFPSND